MDTETHEESKDFQTCQPCNDEINVPAEDRESNSKVLTKYVTKVLNAAGTGDLDVIRKLTAAQRDDVLNSQDAEGRTVLMLAARHGYTAFVRYLLDDGRVFINMQDVKGQTALMMASSHGHTDCVTILLSASHIDIKVKDKKGQSFLELASKNGHLKCVRSLLDHPKLNINSNDWLREKKLAFFLAVLNGQAGCVRLLREDRAKQTANDQNVELGSSIALAIRTCSLDCLKYLVHSRTSGSDLANAIEVYQDADFFHEKHVRDIIKLMLKDIFGEIMDDRDNTCLAALYVVSDLYKQIYSDPGMIKTMIWCSASILYTPTLCVCCLYERGASHVSIFKGCVDTILALAVANSHLDCVAGLLGNIQTPCLELTTLALVIAAYKGSVEYLRCFLEPSVRNGDEMHIITQNLLLLASLGGHIACIKYLLDNCQLDINYHSKYGDTAITLSTMSGHLECLQYLLDTEMTEIDHHNDFGNTAFMLAAMNGHVKCMKHLLGTGQIDINHCNLFRDNALMLAAMNGHVECVEFLLDTRSIDINRHNKSENTAFTLAAMNGHVKCIKSLLATGQVDINHGNWFGYNAFMLSAMNGHTECLKCLLHTRRIDINHRNRFESSALSLSITNGHVECVQFLLSNRQVDLNYCDRTGSTALTLLAEKGFVECVKSLLDTRQVTIHGRIALMSSTIYGPVECARCTLGFQQIDNKSGNEDIVLAIRSAISHKHLACLDVLLNQLPRKNQRVWQCLKAIFGGYSPDVRELGYIPLFLNAGIFRWNWYPSFHHRNRRFLIRELLTCGYVPRRFKWRRGKGSLLLSAFMLNDDGLIRYLIANLYFTQYDTERLRNDKELTKKVILKGSKSVKELHHEIFSSPWRLEALSLLKVSFLLRDERRENDIKQLVDLIPNYFLRLLGFKNSIGRLCQHQWEQIQLNHMYLLHGHRSITLVENNLVPCDCCAGVCLGL